MELISPAFVIFLAGVLAVYHILPTRGQNVWLLACSLYFAASWRWEFAAILAVSILLNYFLGIRIARAEHHRKIWLFTGLAVNAAGLILFRFAAAGWIDLLVRTLAGERGFTTQILLPIGFSFYTLQAISYLLDVSQKQIRAEDDLVNFGVFLAYFPHILSGPIERGKAFLPQLRADRVVRNDTLAEAGWLILVGLFRKLVIAGLLFTLLPSGIFSRPLEFAQSDRWISMLTYSYWLYNDFAGYTSLVRGISLLFGIRLSPNFKQPFFSHNMLDFWNRWHISLSFWLRDYIFFPIQRSLVRRGLNSSHPLRIILPPLVTMLVSGFWHNASFSLAAWGLLHGLFQIRDHFMATRTGYIPPQKQPHWKQIINSLRVNLLAILAWVFFASGGLKLAVSFFNALFAGGGLTHARPLDIVAPLAALLASFFLDALQEKNGEEYAVKSLPRLAQSACVAFLFLCIVLSILWSNVPSASFVYQGF
jgi:D-alanyl-lipoteichoic acid acyltransferase DltB (MBOAT superfamily)